MGENFCNHLHIDAPFRVLGSSIPQIPEKGKTKFWKKVKKGLSAGRVQSVATKLICDREKEINDFVEQEYWTVDANLLKVKKKIVAKKDYIINANKEDIKVNKKQIKIKEFLKIIDSYENSECVMNSDERKIVIFKGDPYITLHVCLQALTLRNKILIVQNNFMYGVNEVLIKIIETVLNDYKITNLITHCNDYTTKDIFSFKKMFDEIIVIGDTMLYQQLIDDDEINVKFYPYNNICMFSDNKEFEKL